MRGRATLPALRLSFRTHFWRAHGLAESSIRARQSGYTTQASLAGSSQRPGLACCAPLALRSPGMESSAGSGIAQERHDDWRQPLLDHRLS